MFMRAAALGNIMCDLLYWETHRQLVNAKGGRGGKASPSIKLRLGPSLNWRITKGGRLDIDGQGRCDMFRDCGEAVKRARLMAAHAASESQGDDSQEDPNPIATPEHRILWGLDSDGT